MASLKDISVKIKLDNSEFKKAVSDTQSQTSKMSSNMKSSLSGVAKAVTAAFTVGAIATFGKTCLMAAADLEQTMRRNKTIFGDMAGDVSEWGLANERAFGLGAGTIEAMAGSLADLSQGMGVSKADSIALAQEATHVAVALGNWNGTGAPEAMADIEKAMTGNFTVLEKYGIKLNKSILDEKARAAGLGDSFDALDATAKQQLILTEITNASANAIEYYNEGNRSMSFLLTEIKEQFGNICEVIGMSFLPIVQQLLAWIGDAIAIFAQFSSAISDGQLTFEEVQAMMESGFAPAFLMLIDIWRKAQEAWEVLSTFLKDTYNTMIAPLFQGFQELSGETVNKFGESTGSMMDAFTNFGAILTDVWNGVIKPVWDLFMDVLFTAWGIYNDNIGNMMGLWKTFSDALRSVWDNVLKPVFDKVMEFVRKLWDTFKQYMPEIQRIVNEVFSVINDIWNRVLKPVFEAIGWYIETQLLPTWDRVFTYGILPVIDSVFKSIIDLWDNSLKPIFNGIIDFIDGVFTGNWRQAWEGVKSIFKGVFSGLETIAKAPINAVISMFNKMIDGLNSFKVPDWVPGLGGTGINIPKIPRLWKGSNFTLGGPTLVGEQGPELVNMPRGASVMPAHKTRSALKATRTHETSRTANIIVELDGRTLSKAMGEPLVDMIRLKTGLSL